MGTRRTEYHIDFLSQVPPMTCRGELVVAEGLRVTHVRHRVVDPAELSHRVEKLTGGEAHVLRYRGDDYICTWAVNRGTPAADLYLATYFEAWPACREEPTPAPDVLTWRN